MESATILALPSTFSMDQNMKKYQHHIDVIFNAFYASREGYGESAHLQRLTLALVTVPKSHVLSRMAMCVLFTPAA